MVTTSTNSIEKKIVLRAPQERVWRAISDSKQFATWFGFSFDGEFAAGTTAAGRISGSNVDTRPEKPWEAYVGLPIELHIDRIDPMSLFSYRWHPHAHDPNVDYSSEPMTLVTFGLESVPGGTLLTITESGFDALSPARRADAFESNEDGWGLQMQFIEKYLALPAA